MTITRKIVLYCTWVLNILAAIVTNLTLVVFSDVNGYSLAKILKLCWRKEEYRPLCYLTKANTKTKRLYPPFLSLDTFDDSEYDCRRPDDWLKLGVVNDLMVHRNLFPERLYCLSLEKTLPIQTSLNGWMLGYFGMIQPLNCTLSKLSGWVESSTM